MQSKHKNAVTATATGMGAVALVGGLFLLSQPTLTQAAPQSSAQNTRLSAPTGADKEGPEEKDDDESNDANLKASITPAQASSAAQKVQPGKVGDVELEDENGTVVYSVEITSKDGKKHEVKVDANTGKVLKNEADDGEKDDDGSGDKGDGDGEAND